MNNDFELLLSFCDFILESVPSISFFEKDNPNRLKLVEDFLEEWSETLVWANGKTDGYDYCESCVHFKSYCYDECDADAWCEIFDELKYKDCEKYERRSDDE